MHFLTTEFFFEIDDFVFKNELFVQRKIVQIYAVLVQIRSLTRSRDGYECRLIFSRSNFLSEIYDQVTSYPEIQSVRNSDFGPFRTIIVRVLLKDQNRNTHSFMIT